MAARQLQPRKKLGELQRHAQVLWAVDCLASIFECIHRPPHWLEHEERLHQRVEVARRALIVKPAMCLAVWPRRKPSHAPPLLLVAGGTHGENGLGLLRSAKRFVERLRRHVPWCWPPTLLVHDCRRARSCALGAPLRPALSFVRPKPKETLRADTPTSAARGYRNLVQTQAQRYGRTLCPWYTMELPPDGGGLCKVETFYFACTCRFGRFILSWNGRLPV